MPGETIRYKGTERESNANIYSETFNTGWADYVAELVLENPDVDFTFIDLRAFFADLMANYEDYGFERPGRGMARDCIFDSGIDQSKHIFYDGLHPSTRAHKILAEKFTR